jgi:hypothetical protein
MTAQDEFVTRLIDPLFAARPERFDAIAAGLNEVVRALRCFVLPGKTNHTQRIAHRAAWDFIQALDDVRDMVRHPSGESVEVGLDALERALRALTTLLDVASLEIMK